jgi:hypothetical protein
MLTSLPLRPGEDAAILAKLDAMEKPRTGKRGPGLFRFRMGEPVTEGSAVTIT